MFYAHSLPGHPESSWQPLNDHLDETGRLASFFAGFGASETARLLGVIHDIGKRSAKFQQRLRGKKQRVDHSSAAAFYLFEEWGNDDAVGRLLSRLLSYVLFGHHGGMPDFGSAAEEGSVDYRLSSAYKRTLPDWKTGGIQPLPSSMQFVHELAPLMCMEGKRPDAFAISFLEPFLDDKLMFKLLLEAF